MLEHWREAIGSKANLKAYEEEILAIPEAGELPVIELLAYNLEKTARREVCSTVERARQDAFGIQVVWEKKPKMMTRRKRTRQCDSRLEKTARSIPVLTLEAVLAKAALRSEAAKAHLAGLTGAPTLLVGHRRLTIHRTRQR